MKGLDILAFGDDTSVNVQAAREAGLSTFLVDGIVELETQLQRLDLIDLPGGAGTKGDRPVHREQTPTKTT